MKVGFVQFNPIFGKKEENIARTISLLERTNAELAVLPELCTTGYLFISEDELSEMAEEIPGPTTETWQRISSEQKLFLVAGIAERTNDGFYNSAVLICPDGRIEVYRKAHLFDEEKEWFLPGNTPFEVYDIGLAKIGMMICFDWFFPEVTRILSLKGAQIICHPANLILPYCQDAMVTRCLENRVFAVTCNRTGIEDRSIRNVPSVGEYVPISERRQREIRTAESIAKTDKRLRFTGKSQIVDPRGQIITQAGGIGEAVRVIDIDVSQAENKSINLNNDLFNDRRTDLYSPILASKTELIELELNNE